MTQQHDQRRPRVLLLAYACVPGTGSEGGVGWNRAIESARQFDTWVICEENWCGPAIRRHVEAHGAVPGLTVVFVPKSAIARVIAAVPGLYYVSYNLWQRLAYRTARRLHAEQRFDLVHQVTYCGYREPGYLWRLDVPFVWGPVGGTQNYPWRFLAQAGLRGAARESLRNVLNVLQLRFSRRVRRAAGRAAAFLTANSTNQRDFATLLGSTPILMLETGLSTVQRVPRTGRPDAAALRILWSGNLAPHKALQLLLKALAALPADLPRELRIVGDGSMRRSWQRLARRLGVDPQIRWMGRLPHADALRQYEWADVFVFTSLRDTSGNALLEALGAGVPVICLDHQGAGDIVTHDCGIKIAVSSPRQVITDLASAIRRLAIDVGARERLARGALERARRYLWTTQADDMAAVYRRVMAGPTVPAAARVPARVAAASPKDLGRRAGAAIGVGLTALLGSRARDRFGILVYHRIAPYDRSDQRPSLNVTPQNLRAQLTGLLARGFKPIPLQQALGHAAGGGRALPSRSFVVTFDDGFASVYSHAWPILRELGVPATIFLSTAYLDSSEPFPFDAWGLAEHARAPSSAYRPLTTAQCVEMMAGQLVQLGAHTHTHRDLRGRPDEFRRDLQQSVDVLRRRFDVTDVPFAFPYGRRHTGFSGDDLMDVARSAGVTCGLTTDAALVDVRSDPFGWGRFNVYGWDTTAMVAARLDGWYEWAPALQARLARGSRAAA